MGSVRISNHDVRQFVEEAKEQGWVLSGKTKGGHYRLDHPETGASAFLPSTPSDWRSVANCRTKLKRAIQAKTPHRKGIAQ